jgi:hypothetical protein
MGLGHLQRLGHMRDLLAARGTPLADRVRLLCFSGAGFADDLRRAADHDDGIQLVGLERLYGGG